MPSYSKTNATIMTESQEQEQQALIKEINISSFISPYMFWFTYKGFMYESEVRLVEGFLRQHYENRGKEKDYTFIVGELVVVFTGTKWARATIEDIQSGERENETVYSCWLVDYGIMFNASRVHQLNEKYHGPFLAKQACLNKVVFTAEKLNFSEGSTLFVRVKGPSVSARRITADIVLKHKTLKFVQEDDCCEILFGDILYSDGDESKSLRDRLVDLNLGVVDEEYFKGIIDYEMLTDKSLHVNELLHSSITYKEEQRSEYEFEDVENDYLSLRRSARCISASGERPDNIKRSGLRNEKNEVVPLNEQKQKQNLLSKLDAMRKSTSPSLTPDKNETAATQSGVVSCTEGSSPIPSVSNFGLSQIKKKINKRRSDEVNLVESPERAETTSSETDVNKSSEIREAESSVEEDGEKISTKQILLDIIRKRKQKYEKAMNNESIESDSDFDRSDSSIGKQKGQFSPEENSETRHRSVLKMENNQSGEERLKKYRNNGIVMMPAGASLSFQPKSTKSIEAQRTLQKSVESSMSESESQEKNCTCKNNQSREDRLKKYKDNGIVMIPAGASLSFQPKSTKSIKAQRTVQKSVDSSLSESESKQKNCSCSESSETKDKNESDSKRNDSAGETAVRDKSLVKDMKIKPHCSCKDCDFWTHSPGWVSNADAAKKKIVADDSTRPPPLLLKEPELLRPGDIKSIEYNKMTKIEILSRPKLLVHGRLLPLPMSSIAEADLEKGILQSLKSRNYVNLIKAQRYSWPGIMNGLNVCVVNRANTGKMIAYLPPLCSILLDENERYKDVAKYPGPMVLIVCPNSTKCQEVYDKMKVITNYCSGSRLNFLTVTYPVNSLKLDTVDVLITIPSVLMFLLQAYVVTLKRLCHLVFDGFDTILDRYKTNVHQLLEIVERMLERRNVEIGVQLVATCETWTLDVEEIMKRLSSVPFIIIGNPLEAALYGRVDLNMQFLQKSMKPSKLVDILKGKFKVFKTVVICRQDEMDELAVMLRLEGIDLLVVSDQMKKENIMDLESKWNSLVGGTYIVLLCTDESLNTTALTVTDATLVVHYCLPERWSIFVKRFYCFLDVIKSPLINQEKKKLSCESYILTDESCVKQIPKFLKFLQRMKQKLPQNFTVFLTQNIHSQEKMKVSDKVPLCPNLKLLGKCRVSSCDSRHILSRDLDHKPGYPRSGRIKFRILKLNDVTNYAAVLLEHANDRGVVSIGDFKSDPSSDLTAVMNVKRIPTVDLRKGLWYAYHEIVCGESIYHRCEVSHVHENNRVTIRLLDHCREISRAAVSSMFELPEKFHDLPVTVVDIYVACMVPPFEDDGFSHYSFSLLQRYLARQNYGEMTLSADIFLQLGSTFWVKNIVEETAVDGKLLIRYNFSKKLQDWQLVSANQDQLNNLYSLCRDANIELPDYLAHKERAVVKKHEEQVKPQWAFLDEDRIQDVTFAAAVSPNEFYVRLNKFENLLLHLQEEIQDLIKKPFYDRQLSVKTGRCFLAKDEESREYCRVQVIKVKDGLASCFFVDYGDERNVNIDELKHIPNHIISKLPFQTVRCRLYGIKPSLDDWQDEATDILYNYAFEPDSDIYRELYVRTCIVEKVGLTRKKYAVLLKEGYSSRCTLLNQLLIDCGFAVPNDNEALTDFEIPRVVDDSDSVDSDVEEVLDILRKTTQVQDNRVCLPEHTSQDGQNGVDLENDNELEFVAFDMEGFVGQLREFGLRTEPMEQATAVDLAPIRAAPAGKYRTPPVVWSQTESSLTLTIRIAYITEDFVLTLTKGRLLKFRATVNDKDYALKLILLKDVESTFQHSVVGSEIRIRMKKTEEAVWPKLVTGNVKLRNITYDFSTLKLDGDDDERRRKFLHLGDIDDQCSDDDDDDLEDDLNYVDFTDSDSDAEFVEYDSDS